MGESIYDLGPVPEGDRELWEAPFRRTGQLSGPGPRAWSAMPLEGPKLVSLVEEDTLVIPPPEQYGWSEDEQPRPLGGSWE